jgi:hypothetical protein
MLPSTTAADASRAHRSRSLGLFDDGDPELALRASAQPIRAAGAADEPAAPATPPRVITAADRAAQDRYLEESFGLCATDEALEAQIARLYLTAAPSAGRLPSLAPDESGSGSGTHVGYRRQLSADGESGPFVSVPSGPRADGFFSGAPKSTSLESASLFEGAVTGGREGSGALFG